MWILILINMSVSMFLHLMLIISIIPRVLLKTTILALDLVIELAKGVRAILGVLKALVRAMESYASDITYLMTLSIKGAMVAKDKNTAKIINQAVMPQIQ